MRDIQISQAAFEADPGAAIELLQQHEQIAVIRDGRQVIWLKRPVDWPTEEAES